MSISRKNVPTKNTAHSEGDGAPKASDAQTAYESRKPAWKALGGAELKAPRTNVAFATSRVLQLAAALAEPATLAAFDALAAVPLPDGTTYDAGAVRLLPTIASALWYARTRYLTASAQSTTVALPPDAVAAATKLRDAMFRVVEFHCVDPSNAADKVAADLASIRAVEGPRYLDLATDLSRLAAYYRSPQWLPVLSTDARHFRASDGEAAERAAADILARLHQDSDEAATWLVELYRGWADLERTYDVVRRGASFVFWGDEARVPPLGSLRPAPRKTAAAAAEDDPAPEPDEPAPPAKKTA
jgi:hypothetical protein